MAYWYSLKEFFWQYVYPWQTLIAGLLAVAAGTLTVWATIRAANREVAAAQAQTAVAQEQIATTLRLEQRRNTREAWACYVALQAAMATVIENVSAARGAFPPGGSMPFSEPAYEARQKIRRSMFPELRSALLRIGGNEFTGSFLCLDNKIDDFAAQWTPDMSTRNRTGKHADFHEELDQIEREAKALREEAGTAIQRCLKEFG